MSGKNTKFQLIDGRIFLIVEQLIWGEWLELLKEDVTDKVMPVVDDHLDIALGLQPQYKSEKGKIKYTGNE